MLGMPAIAQEDAAPRLRPREASWSAGKREEAAEWFERRSSGKAKLSAGDGAAAGKKRRQC